MIRVIFSLFFLVLIITDILGETQCKKAKRQAEKLYRKYPSLTGRIPKCTKDGLYEPKQCSGSSGYCWCVEPITGKEIPNTIARPWVKQVNCNKFNNNVVDQTKCEKEKLEVEEKYNSSDGFPIGLDIPKCTKDGLYERKQCSGSSGYCWCVEPKTGNKIPNTESRPWIKEVNCIIEFTELENTVGGKTKCEKEKLDADEKYNRNDGFPIVGLDIPKCTKDGLYERKQCSGSSGYCWCVEPKTGYKIPNTEARPWIKEVNCIIEFTELENTVGGKTKCEKEKLEADEKYNSNDGFPIVGLDIPKCTKDGLYERKQCSGSSGYCWCVEPKTGNKIPNTESRPWIKEVNCIIEFTELENTVSGKTKCEKEKLDADKKYNSNDGFPIVGLDIPKCTKDGLYERKQCSGSSGYCWCVEPKTGDKIPNTESRPWIKEVNCIIEFTELENTVGGKTKCEKEKLDADEKYNSNDGFPIVGLDIPKCTKDGLYERKQCSGSSGYCWCVEPKTGNKIPNTESRPWIKQVNCESPESENTEVKKTKCPKEKFEAEEKYHKNQDSPIVGLDIPKCSKDGLYERKQCSASSGYCWCVKPKTGEKIPNTEGRPWAKEVNCESPELVNKVASKTKCEKEKFEAEEKYDNNQDFPIIGLDIPKCTKDGLYEEKQCAGSSGYCWCVEQKTGEKIPNTEGRPWTKDVNCEFHEVENKVIEKTKCEKEKFEAEGKYNNPKFPIMGLDIPQCTEDGLYERKQCSGSRGYCWCVEPKTGKEIPNTFARPWIKEVNCDSD